MKSLVINNSTKTIKNTLKMLSPYETKVIDFRNLPFNNYNFDFIVISGGSLEPAFYESTAYKEEFEFIRNTNKPIFGICLGMQIISQAFSPNKLIKLETKRRSVMEIDIDENIFGTNKLKVAEAHRWAVGEIGKPLKILGQSIDGPEIIKHETKIIWGVQFHPQSDEEFGTHGKLIFDHFISQFS